MAVCCTRPRFDRREETHAAQFRRPSFNPVTLCRTAVRSSEPLVTLSIGNTHETSQPFQRLYRFVGGRKT